MAAILPLAETIVLGGLDGALRSADVKGGRTSNLKQYSTYLEAGMVAVGAIAAMQRVHPDWWEPAVVGGLFALSQRGGQWLGHQVAPGSFGGPYPNGLGASRVPRFNTGMSYPAGYRAFGGPDPQGLPLGYPPGEHVQPAGVLG